MRRATLALVPPLPAASLAALPRVCTGRAAASGFLVLDVTGPRAACAPAACPCENPPALDQVKALS